MMIKPASWLGVLGGGQLGRMFCQSAQAMGYRVLVLEPDAQAPACQIADDVIERPYNDRDALMEMARRCSAVTTEFENVPADSLALLARTLRVTPSAQAVEIVQDRATEKNYIESLKIPVAPHVSITSVEDFDQAPIALLEDGILKLTRLGYDGKGQHRIASLEQAREAFVAMGELPCVLEARLALQFEISVVLARGLNGHIVTYDVARNVHHDGILAVTHVDGEDSEHARQARRWAADIAESMGYHGVLCVEFFVLTDGSLIVNEIGPRPHNSGHFSQNACVTSQFEQQARVMAGLPLGDTRLLAPAVMLNLLGDVWLGSDGEPTVDPDWTAVLAHPGAALHLYGKREARAGRKMGHINVTAKCFAEAVKTANEIVDLLGLPQRATLK